MIDKRFFLSILSKTQYFFIYSLYDEYFKSTSEALSRAY